MKILDIHDFVFERMKIMPISNDEFERVEEYSKNPENIDQLKYINLGLLHKSKLKNGVICKSCDKIWMYIPKELLHLYHDIDKTENVSEGIFAGYSFSDMPYWMPVSDYNNNLKCIVNDWYSISKIWKTNINLRQLTTPESFEKLWDIFDHFDFLK